MTRHPTAHRGRAGTGTNFLFIGSDARRRWRRPLRRHRAHAHRRGPQDRQPGPLPARPLRRRPGPRQGQDQRRLRLWRRPLLVQTIQELVGVRIHHVAKTDFEGFKADDRRRRGRPRVRRGVEQLQHAGLATIHEGLERPERGHRPSPSSASDTQLSEGDISRGRRQLAFIKALMLKATSKPLSRNPLKIAKFTDAATQNLVLDQDLTIGQLRDYAVSHCATSAAATSSSHRTVHRLRHLTGRRLDRHRRQEGHGRPRRGAA